MHAVRFRFLRCALAGAVVACGTSGGNAPVSDGGSPVSVGTMTTSQFGAILVGTNGMALYTKAGDSAATSTCADTCVTAWPPLTVSLGQQAVGGPGVQGTFGSLTRYDGTIQATYDGRPLYYWHLDDRAGAVTGDGIDGFSVATP